MVRRVLKQVAETGLPEGHNFLIRFSTRHPGVRVPASLRVRYPKLLVIAIEHQFWDLSVTEDDFSVTLSFGDKRDNIVVPFAALVSFEDPFAPFHINFPILAEDVVGPDVIAPLAPAATNSLEEMPKETAGKVIKVHFGKRAEIIPFG